MVLENVLRAPSRVEDIHEEVQGLERSMQSNSEQLELIISSFTATLERMDSAAKATAETNALLTEQNGLLRKQLELANKAVVASQNTLTTAEGIRLAVTAPLRADMDAVLGVKQLSMMDTLERIAADRLSFARYGDGEIRLMMREEYNIRFQKNAPGLKVDLAKVLDMGDENLLIGMPHRFVNSMWGSVFAENWAGLKPQIEKIPLFGDSHVSRPIFFDFYQQAAVDAWRRVWEGRDALIVAGRGSRFELIDALFDNLGSTSLVEGEPRNAYIHIESVMADISRNLQGKDLVLIALGPAGTIIAARLAEMGIQAIDVGHIAASYRAVFSGDVFPEMQPVSQL